MEPPDAAADRFADRLVASVASASRYERFSAVLAKLKLVTAAAACVAIGFSVGWLGRGGEMGALRTGVATTSQQTLTAPIGSGGSGLAVRQPQAGGHAFLLNCVISVRSWLWLVVMLPHRAHPYRLVVRVMSSSGVRIDPSLRPPSRLRGGLAG